MAGAVLIASSVSFAYLLLSAFLDFPIAAKLDYAAYPGLFLLAESALFFVVSISGRIVFLTHKNKAALTGAEKKADSRESAERDKKRKVLSLDGLSCGHCAMKVESALLDVPGVESVRIDLLARSASVSGHELKDAELISAVVKAGYRVTGILGSR
jgi:copper chaperone